MNHFDILPEVGLASMLKDFYTSKVFLGLSDGTSVIYSLESQELESSKLPLNEYRGGVVENKLLYVYSDAGFLVWSLDRQAVVQSYPIGRIEELTVSGDYIFIKRSGNVIEVYKLGEVLMLHQFTINEMISEIFSIKAYKNHLFIAGVIDFKLVIESDGDEEESDEEYISGVLVYNITDDDFKLTYLKALSYDYTGVDRELLGPTMFDVREFHGVPRLVVVARTSTAFRLNDFEPVYLSGDDGNHGGPLGVDIQDDLTVESDLGVINIMMNGKLIQELTFDDEDEAFNNLLLVNDHLLVVSEGGYLLHYRLQLGQFVLVNRLEFQDIRINTVVRL